MLNLVPVYQGKFESALSALTVRNHTDYSEVVRTCH
jgi:hypothetical protein